MGAMDDDPMYLQKRENGVYYFRRPIPPDVAGIVPKVAFQHSLKTKKRLEALHSHHLSLFESEKLIEQARQKLRVAVKDETDFNRFKYPLQTQAARLAMQPAKPFESFTRPQLLSMLQHWFQKEKRDCLTRYRSAYLYADDEQKCELEQDLDDDVPYLRQPDEHRDADGLRELKWIILDSLALQILENEDSGFPKDRMNNPLFREFYELLSVCHVKLHELSHYVLKKGELPPEQSPLTPLLAGVPEISRAPEAPLTLDEAIENFKRLPERADLHKRTHSEYEIIFTALREQIGAHTMMHAINRKAVRELQEIFRKLPSRAKQKFPGKSFREIADIATEKKLPPLEAKTFNKRMSMLHSLFAFARREGHAFENPAEKLTVPEPSKPLGEKSFTVDQLNLIFSGEIFRAFAAEPDARLTPNHPLQPHMFWTPLIGLFQGIRENEILQIRLKDFHQWDGVDAIMVHKGHLSQSIKNKPTRRRIPIHPTLKMLGFLDYLAALKLGGEERIFPDAGASAYDGKYSGIYQKKFSRYVRKLIPELPRGQGFHNFRHGFADGLHNAEVKEHIIKRLGGWTRGKSSFDGYGGRLPQLLFNELSKLKYEGFDLSHLLPASSKPPQARVRKLASDAQQAIASE